MPGTGYRRGRSIGRNLVDPVAIDFREIRDFRGIECHMSVYPLRRQLAPVAAFPFAFEESSSNRQRRNHKTGVVFGNTSANT